MSEHVEVEHNPQKQCFLAVVDGHQAVLEYRTVGTSTLDFHHTYVPDALRGKGVAAILAKAGLAFAKQQGYKVIPSCSYIEVYLQRHPQ